MDFDKRAELIRGFILLGLFTALVVLMWVVALVGSSREETSTPSDESPGTLNSGALN